MMIDDWLFKPWNQIQDQSTTAILNLIHSCCLCETINKNFNATSWFKTVIIWSCWNDSLFWSCHSRALLRVAITTSIDVCRSLFSDDRNEIALCTILYSTNDLMCALEGKLWDLPRLCQNIKAMLSFQF